MLQTSYKNLYLKSYFNQYQEGDQSKTCTLYPTQMEYILGSDYSNNIWAVYIRSCVSEGGVSLYP